MLNPTLWFYDTYRPYILFDTNTDHDIDFNDYDMIYYYMILAIICYDTSRLYVLGYDFSDDSKDVCFASGLETNATTSGRPSLSEVYAFLADGDGWIDGHGRVGALGALVLSLELPDVYPTIGKP